MVFQRLVFKVFFFLSILFYVVDVLSACKCVHHVCSVTSGQKRALDPLELVLQVVSSHHVDSVN